MSADIKIFTDDIEDAALDQCHTIAKSPVFETARIRIMPDVHAGKGCVIGFTATGMEKLIPNLVGVDIGCGMLTARLDTDDLDLAKLDRLIAQSVPAGFDVHDHEVAEAQRYLDELVCRDRIKNKSRLLASLGTLGGGNHFIEVDADEDGRLYLVIHTGSRKGAVSAGLDEMLLIPMNMRDGCLLCRGLGNEDWNCSAPHGAGRLMSRATARESIPLEDFVESMRGIYTTSVCAATIDESPFAYKDAEAIRKRIGATARIERTLKPVYNFKAH